MKKYILLTIVVLFVSFHTKGASDFIITSKSSKTNIFIDKNFDEFVKWAVNDLAEELGKILSREINIHYTETFQPEKSGIYIGKFDDKLVDGLLENFNSELND